MRSGSVAIFRGCQRNVWTGKLASFGDTNGFARGKFRSSLISFMGVSPKIWCGRRRWWACQQLVLSPLPTGDPYSCLKTKLRRTYSNKKRRGWKVVCGNADSPLLRSPQRTSQFLPLAMVIVTVETEWSAKNEGCKISCEGRVEVGDGLLVFQM